MRVAEFNQPMGMRTKKLLLTIGIVVVIATSALGQSWDPDVGSGNIAAPPAGETLTGASKYSP
jgi:hypothetical protein